MMFLRQCSSYLRHLLLRALFLVIVLLNTAFAIGDKKFLKGFILGLLFAAQKKDGGGGGGGGGTTHHVMMPYVPQPSACLGYCGGSY